MDYTTLCTREEGSPVDYQMLCEKCWQLQKTLPGIPDEVISKFDKAFEIEYAHNSTAIEGNTLTLVQTKAILEDGLSVGGKTLREIYEVANHARAFNYVKDCIAKGRPLDEQVINSIVSLRSLAAKGDLTNLDDSALNLRSMVFKRDYTYGNTDAASQLSQLITDKQAQLAELNRSLNQVSTMVYATASGVWSAGVDGWEGVVTPAMLDELTASSLAALLEEKHTPDDMAVGKLVTDSTWYFAALLDARVANIRVDDGEPELVLEGVEAAELERFCDALEAHEQAEQAMGDMTP